MQRLGLAVAAVVVAASLLTTELAASALHTLRDAAAAERASGGTAGMLAAFSSESQLHEGYAAAGRDVDQAAAAMHAAFHSDVQRSEAAEEGSDAAGSAAELKPAAASATGETYPGVAVCTGAVAWRNLTRAEERAMYPACSGGRGRSVPQGLKFLLKICRKSARMPYALADARCDTALSPIRLWRAIGARRTLFLAGDSIFHTQFWALVCQLKGYRTRVITNSSIEPETGRRWVSLCVGAPGGVGADGARVCYRDWMPWKLGVKAPETADRALRLLLHQSGGIDGPSPGDVVVMNAGHHLPTPEHMRRALPVIAEVLGKICGVRLLWAETSPTAYPLPSGDEYEFQHAAEDRSRHPCGENTSAASLSNWRNEMLRPVDSERCDGA
eukprot:TRINITY_DN7488_c0_g1_i2.p1 TRINITY_DN7488_c0_g1~~TRINITY_DN7488_c0_g1_i2.p1  ORF type:complete len:386 (+),score=63.26 TRINITY_DN7488_c0_g1_i2:347-1504(+)